MSTATGHTPGSPKRPSDDEAASLRRFDPDHSADARAAESGSPHVEAPRRNARAAGATEPSDDGATEPSDDGVTEPSDDGASAGEPRAAAEATGPAPTGGPSESAQRTGGEPGTDTHPAVTTPAGTTIDDEPAPASAWRRIATAFAAADDRRRLLVSALLTVILVLVVTTPLGNGLGAWLRWLELALALPVVTWGAWPFHAASLRPRRIAAREAWADTLVALAVALAFCWSLVALVTGAPALFGAAAVITTVALATRLSVVAARTRGRAALDTLTDLAGGDVTVLGEGVGGTTTQLTVPTAELAVGSRFLVHPGERVAADGVLTEGATALDTSLFTGDPAPVEVGPGDPVSAGTINTASPVVVRAEAVGSDTALAGLIRSVEEAEHGRTPLLRLADRLATLLGPLAVLLAALAAGVGLWTGQPAAQAISAAVAVLVAAAPAAAALAGPSALLTGAGRGAQLGVLGMTPHLLEATRRVDAVLLDPAATVTTGDMRLVEISPAGRLTSTAALQAAGAVAACALETGDDPAARAVVAAARERGLAVPAATDTTGSTDSTGSAQRRAPEARTARIKDTEVTLGRAECFARVPEEIAKLDVAGTAVYVGWHGVARAAFTLADGVRPDAASGVERLQELGLHPFLLTGDTAPTAGGMAQQIGIAADDVFAGVRPARAPEVVQQLRDRGLTVAMVGDGVADAPALAAADLGIAMAPATTRSTAGRPAPEGDTAPETLTLLRRRLAAVADALVLSRRTLRIGVENLAVAFGYHVVALPLAAFGVISPVVAALASAVVSVVVVLNSLRLRGVRATSPADE